jgi:hypothetical protein
LNQVALDPVYIDQINGTAKKAKTILAQINSQGNPLEKELILAFEQSQALLSQEITALINGLKNDKKIHSPSAVSAVEKKFNHLESTAFFNFNRYNTEARYFNTRKSIFPGFLIAKLFKLDETHIYEIDTDLFKPEKLRS